MPARRVPISFYRQLLINQLLRVNAIRGLVDSISSRPSLAPQNADRTDIWSDPFHPELPLRKLRTIRGLVGDPNLCRGKMVVEIGPGMSLGMGIVGLASGARQCVLVDRDRFVTRDERSARSHRDILELVPEWIDAPDPRYRDGVVIRGDDVVPNGASLSYLIAPGEALPIRNGRADLVISHSTLEHVRDLEAVARELARITVPGGLGVHQVDLSDHLHPDDPLKMLQLSRRQWDLIASQRRGWTNRLRLSDHLRSYEACGFTVEKLEITRALAASEIDRLRPDLDPQFRELPGEVLSVLGFYCVLRRG